MASKVKKTVRKKVRKIKKSPAYKLTSVIFAIIVIAAGYYYATYMMPSNTPTYSANQNAEGFYYYTLVDAQDYYYDANNLIGENLKNELNDILNTGFTPTSYAEAKTHLAIADRSLTDPTKVYNVYNGLLVNATWDSVSWHREHVWPNSRLGMERVTESNRNQGSDLHNLRAITPSVNSSRSDRFFSNASGQNQTTSDGGYYPGDAHKGDVARIILYMAVKYEFLVVTDEGLDDDSNPYTMERIQMGKLSLLLEWHKEDPVDDFERSRNQHIYEAQGNRNPFIDKPEYVHLIWEGKTIIEITESDPISSNYQVIFIDLISRKRGLFYV
ncbi:MAG: endonuclease [Acholeplasmataceae bacterium]|nr:endonuclease [Acholeplasmataceae bacterium]